MRASSLPLLVAVALALPVLAQDGADGKKDAAPPPEKKSIPAEKKPEPAPGKKPDGEGSELERLLGTWVADPEPQRELKRLYASSLYFLIERDLERFVACFHPDFHYNVGTGSLQPLPPHELRALVKKGWAERPKSALKLEELLDLKTVRVYSKKEALAAKHDGWKKEPPVIAEHVQDGDFLVIAATNKKAIGEKAADFEQEVFYVMRKHDGRYKIVLGE